ncbi:hypothetical protein M1902_25190, partial [Klebsiella pneumoniae]|nr:hypothetical protein [Klebsiella pneumoniae]
GSAILGCVGCLVGHLFMFLVGGKTPDQSVHLNLTTTAKHRGEDHQNQPDQAHLLELLMHKSIQTWASPDERRLAS